LSSPALVSEQYFLFRSFLLHLLSSQVYTTTVFRTFRVDETKLLKAFCHITQLNQITMTVEVIEKFIKDQNRKGTTVNIHFKERSTVSGIFIHSKDYNELKSKNLWRVVSKSNVDKWKEEEDINLTRIFNGVSFTRLTD
jgi:hypothetical protein